MDNNEFIENNQNEIQNEHHEQNNIEGSHVNEEVFEPTFKRWYENDEVLMRCFDVIEKIPDNYKRQTATFLMEEIISKEHFTDKLPKDIFELGTSEERKRRWYDFDEVVRIFVELLRHSPEDIRKEIAIKAVTFVEDLEH